MDLSNLKAQAKSLEPSNKKFFAKLKKSKPRNLDSIMQNLHEEAFESISCLQCANCCKTTSPIFYQKDIERLAKHFKITPSNFIDQYLYIDEDKDFVLKMAPCPFLGSDNYCSVYEHRPVACREYPHTDRKRFHQILDLTLKNTAVCPAVLQIVEKLKMVL
jgi:Fe-S-cluster containining protein